MYNTLLVALTNKTVGFNYPSLNVQQAFTRDMFEPAAEVREVLTSGKDVWAIHLCDLLRYDPLASLNCPPGEMTTDFSDIDLSSGGMIGGELVGNELGAPRVVSTDDVSVALGDVLTFRYSTDNSAVIEYGSTVKYAPVFSISDNELRVEWPDEIGVSGNLRLESTYGPSTVVSIPLRGKYPYENVRELLEDSTRLFDLLTEVDLADAYYFADSDKYKIAIATLAVYKHFIAQQV